MSRKFFHFTVRRLCVVFCAMCRRRRRRHNRTVEQVNECAFAYDRRAQDICSAHEYNTFRLIWLGRLRMLSCWLCIRKLLNHFSLSEHKCHATRFDVFCLFELMECSAYSWRPYGMACVRLWLWYDIYIWVGMIGRVNDIAHDNKCLNWH